MDAKDFSSKIFGLVGKECMALEALELLKDEFYGVVRPKDNDPNAVSENNGVSTKIPIRQIRSRRLKRKDFSFLKKFRKADVLAEDASVEKEIPLRYSIDILATYNEKVNNIIENSSFNEASANKIMNEISKKTSKKLKNTVQEDQVHEERPELPLMYKEKIEEIGGTEVKLVIQKELTNSDVSENNNRLAIPTRRVIEIFLTPMEELSLDYVPQKKKGKKGKMAGMAVFMLDHNLNLWDDMYLKLWKMETTEIYNITGKWYTFVANNNLRAGQMVQLWSFRRNGQLFFAFVKM